MSPRLDVLRERMAGAGEQALLITNLPDVRYLCGFSGSNGALLVTEDDVLLATDGRYVVQAGEESPGVELVVTRRLVPDLLAAAVARGLTRVGFDPRTMSVAAWRGAAADVPEVALEPAEVDISGLRQVKDDEELAALRQACAISTRALAALTAEIRVGMTELELAGSSNCSWAWKGRRTGPSTASSPAARTVPSRTTSPPPARSRPGTCSRSTSAPCTTGTTPTAPARSSSPPTRRTGSRRSMRSSRPPSRPGWTPCGPGMTGQEVDRVARQVIEDAGYGKFYGHGLGHGVGLEIHEAPFLGPTSTNTVEARVPLTVEPGIYLPDRGGVRIEDTLIVFSDGVEILTDFPRVLARVG